MMPGTPLNNNPFVTLTAREIEDCSTMLKKYMIEYVTKYAGTRSMQTLLALQKQKKLNEKSVITVNFRIGFGVKDLMAMANLVGKK